MNVVIVTGSRKWSRVPEIKALWAKLDELDPDIVVHGGALGADTEAHKWAKKRGRRSYVYFPNYDKIGKGAPLVRNVQMLEDWLEATVVGCPYPDSRGTVYTMKEAEKRGMEVVTLPYAK